MAGTIYSKFFWQDWANEPGLGQCSFAAKGVWIDLLCLAAQSEPIGHVKLAGKVPTTAQLAHHLRTKADVLEPLIQELLENTVCDRATSGALVSRRMVRDARKQRARASGGRVASSASQRNETGNFISRGNTHRQPAPATINHQPESISHQPQKPPPETFEQKLGKIARLGEALGFDPTTARNGHRFIEDLVRLQADGFDFELDILATIQERRAAGSVPRDLGSLAYFRKAFEAKRETRNLTAGIAEQRANAPFEDTDETGWVRRLRNWLDSGSWRPQFGPFPRLEGCRAPEPWLGQARAKWEEQGGHPAGAFPADPNGRYREWKDLRDLRDDPEVDYGNRALNVVAIPRRTA